MDLTTYTVELRESLRAAASIGDDNVQRAAGALSTALEPAARLALMHALSDLSMEVAAQLNASGLEGDRVTVDVRLEGRDLKVVTARYATDASAATDRPGPTAAAAAADDTDPDLDTDTDTPERSFSEASGDLTRTTVRMFNELKARAEKAASEQGVSLNSFISRAVADSMKGDLPRKFRDRQDKGREHRSGHPGHSPSTISGYVQG